MDLRVYAGIPPGGAGNPWEGITYDPEPRGLASVGSGAGGEVAVVAEQTGAHLAEAKQSFLVLDRLAGNTTASFVSRSRGDQ
jgi:hypothetical protein